MMAIAALVTWAICATLAAVFFWRMSAFWKSGYEVERGFSDQWRAETFALAGIDPSRDPCLRATRSASVPETDALEPEERV